jgi:hypothetical protein
MGQLTLERATRSFDAAVHRIVLRSGDLPRF